MELAIDQVNIEGLSIRYGVVAGGRDGPPVLICNGIGQSLETLEPLVAALPNREIILYDAPGAGSSDVPVLPRSVDCHSRIAVALLDILGCGVVDVMGISWGGGPAQRIAYAYPDRCRKLILAITCAGGLTLIPGPLPVILEMSFPTRYLGKRNRRKALSMIYGGDALRDPDIVLRHANRNKRPNLYGYYSQLLVSRCWTSVHWLHKLGQPTMVISGEEDPLIPAINQRILAQLIPNAEFCSYDCGHLVLSTRSCEVGADIETFLSKV